ncbi:hypothetical protein [Marinobacter sp. C2H3]|uniref:hypothetical protein n=1 Tax=Marinobacter sp. C2H3 TaxID=3119003 RepID=UPI00300EAE17
MRKVIAITLEALAGLLVQTALFASFMDIGPSPAQATMILIYLALALPFLLGGLAVNRFLGWRLHLGVLLVGVPVLDVLVIGWFRLMDASGDLQRVTGQPVNNFFNDYTMGTALSGAFAVLGLILLFWHRRRRS